MKRLNFLKVTLMALLFLGLFSFTTVTKTYAQEMVQYEWSAYKTKFSVPSSFEVSKSTDDEWIGGDNDINLSIYPRKGEKLTQREMNANLRTWARESAVSNLTELTDVDSKKLNGYWGVFVEGSKDGLPVCMMLIVDPDYPDTVLYVWVNYREGMDEIVLKILFSFIPS